MFFGLFSCVKESVALGAWRWWLCDETDYSPTQVALCSNLSLHWHSPNPENPRKPPRSTLLPKLPEMIFNPTVSPHFQPLKPQPKKWLFTKTKLSCHVRTEQHRAGRRAAPHCAPCIRPRRKPAGEPSTRPKAAERVFFSNAAKHSRPCVCSCRHAAVLREFPAPVGDLVSSNVIGNLLILSIYSTRVFAASSRWTLVHVSHGIRVRAAP